MTPEQSEKTVTRAWKLSVAGIALILWTGFVPAVLEGLSIRPTKGGWGEILLSVVTLKYASLYLFQPWMFPGITALPGLVVVPLLTYFLYRRSRVAGVLLLSLYVLIKAFMFLWMYVFSTIFIVIWLVVSLLWGYVFLQGTRGTFVHHNMKEVVSSGVGKV